MLFLTVKLSLSQYFAGLRARTMKVYSMYSRRSLERVRDTVEEMGVDYFILEDSWCTRKTRDGCQMPEIWDIEEPENKVGF